MPLCVGLSSGRVWPWIVLHAARSRRPTKKDLFDYGAEFVAIKGFTKRLQMHGYRSMNECFQTNA